MHFFLLAFLCGYCYGLGCNSNPYFTDAGPLVKTGSGIVIGKHVKVFDTGVAAFLGIPFAEPPLGELRFAKPKPIQNWDGILDGSKKSPPCMQYSSKNASWIPSSSTPSENCLFLNVWAPTKCCCDKPSRLPVLVWIYGGGFYAGSSDMDVYDGSTLASYGNVIVVSMNYRVGVFGFINGGTQNASGNLGLYDQNLALRWIQQNIGYFGGNPESITLVGESAGAMSISLHMISPMSENLFHRAIMQSGTSYQPQLVDSVPTSFIKANLFAQAIGCANEKINMQTEPSQVLKCLKGKDALELAKTEDMFTSKMPFYFVPTIGDDFLPRSPIDAFNSGEFPQIEVLIGDNNDEATIFLNYIMPQIFQLDHNPVLKLSDAEKIIESLFQTVSNPPSSEIFKFYFQNITNEEPEAIVNAISDAFGDYSFNCPDFFLAEKANNAYFYWLTHRSIRDENAEWVGVPHFYDVPYVFGVPIQDTYSYTPEDCKFSGDLIQKWVTFASTGHPLKDEIKKTWPKFTPENLTVFELNPRNQNTLPFPRLEACKFWRPYFLNTTV